MSWSESEGKLLSIVGDCTGRIQWRHFRGGAFNLSYHFPSIIPGFRLLRVHQLHPTGNLDCLVATAYFP